MQEAIYRKEYSVHVYELGIDEKLSPFALFNYFQDIAAEHAVNLGFGREDLLKMNCFWVLSRMAVVVKNWPLWKDRLVITTWPRGTDRFFAIRDFKVEYPGGNEVAAATSSWLIVDINTRRIRKPDENLLKNRPGLADLSATGAYAGKIEPLKEFTDISGSFMVKTSDLDVHRHTNNAVYIKWVTDAYSHDFREKYFPCSFEVNYLAESKQGDEIIIKTFKEDNLQFYHSVFRTTDNTELCRIRIGWGDCMH